MADINKWIPFMEEWEGGYANLPWDKGGPTYKGVTLATWQLYAPGFGKPGTVDGLKAMTRQEYEYIIRVGFWNPISGDSIKSNAVATAIADFAYNSGVWRAVRETQQALNDLGQQVAVDGRMGPKTLAAINRVDASKLFDRICDRREAFFRYLAASSPSTYGVSLNGWLNRLDDLISKKKTF